MIGTVLAVAGGFIRYRCYRELGDLFTFEMSIRRDHRLVSSGPYSVVRHPGYTSIMIVMIGVICIHACHGSWLRESGALSTALGRVVVGLYLALVLFITAGLMSRMSKEDEALQKQFPEWVEWRERVPYKLIPWVY